MRDILKTERRYSAGEFLEIGRTEAFQRRVRLGLARVTVEPESGKFIVHEYVLRQALRAQATTNRERQTFRLDEDAAAKVVSALNVPQELKREVKALLHDLGETVGRLGIKVAGHKNQTNKHGRTVARRKSRRAAESR